MPSPFLSGSDAEFDSDVTQYHTYANANSPPLFTVGELALLNPAFASWTTDYPAALAGQAASLGLNAVKDTSRNGVAAVIRTLTNRARGTGLSDTDAAGLGAPIHDTTPTPVGAPATAPILAGDTSKRLEVTVHQSGSPTSKAKPAGVLGCELWIKLGGPPPTDLSECQFVTLDTRTPHTIPFDGSEANQTVHIIGRWLSTRGAPGPLSETLSVTVTA